MVSELGPIVQFTKAKVPYKPSVSIFNVSMITFKLNGHIRIWRLKLEYCYYIELISLKMYVISPKHVTMALSHRSTVQRHLVSECVFYVELTLSLSSGLISETV